MGFAQRQQAELAKQIMIQKARMEKVIKDLKADVGTKIDRAREEVFTVAYTSLERTFGEQSEEMLMGIDHGVQLVLKDFDERYWRMADFKLRGGLNGKQFHVKKHNWDEPTQEEANLVIAVRDEIIDVMAPVSYTHLTLPTTERV